MDQTILKQPCEAGRTITPNHPSIEAGVTNSIGFSRTKETPLQRKLLTQISIEEIALKFISMTFLRKWQPTPVLLPGKSHERRSLVGCSPWGR